VERAFERLQLSRARTGGETQPETTATRYSIRYIAGYCSRKSLKGL